MKMQSWQRLSVGTMAALAGALAWVSLASAAPQAYYLNFATGAPGSYDAVNGYGFTGSDTVTLQDTAGNVYTAQVIEDVTTLPGGAGSNTSQGAMGQIVFVVPVTGSYTAGNGEKINLLGPLSDYSAAVTNDVYRAPFTVYVDGTSTGLTFDSTIDNPNWSTPGQVKPHGNFSSSTDFCLSCHMVHQGNTGAQVQNPYGLLGYDQPSGTTYTFSSTTVPQNVVVAVCANCHEVGTVGPNLPSGYAGPNGGFSGEAVATTAHFKVYKNSNNVAHPMGITSPPDSVDVTMAYLNLNTSSYETTGSTNSYTGQAPTGLYCGSCHSPHGNMSANAWLGWDAAQFSENYGNNYDANATVGRGLPDSDGNDYWRAFIQNGGAGTEPLTNALLINNPGHQNGIGNADTNPNVPSSQTVLQNYQNGGLSMNFAPNISVSNAAYSGSPNTGGWVDPVFGQTQVGATDDTLSNFCMGCHNLNGGAESLMQGHPAHPLQGYLSPDNAGIDQYFTATTSPSDYAAILNGCTDCHGSPEMFGSKSYADGFSLAPPSPNTASATYDSNFYTDLASFDFPHTTPAPSYSPNDDVILKAAPDGLCLSCHDAKAHWSSLP